MKQKDKDLLLKDLCARLPYGVILDYSFIADKQRIHTKMPLTYRNIGTVALDEWHTNEEIFKLYLRPMSSITDEEKKEFCKIEGRIAQDFLCEYTKLRFSVDELDWLNKKMFAYRIIDGKDMFELDLALQAPKGMYKF